MTQEEYEKQVREIAIAYAKKIGAKLLYVNVDCGKFGVELKNGAVFKNIYIEELKDLL